MLAMSRSLLVDPAVLLLDEISMGLAPLVVAELYELVRALAEDGIAILLVEQFARTVTLCPRHTCYRLIQQHQLRLLDEDNTNFKPLLLSV